MPVTKTLSPLELLQAEAPAVRPVVALSEGSDPRVVAGALAAHQAGIADVILIGPKADVTAALQAEGASASEGVAVHDPAASGLTEAFAAEYHSLRKHKGVDEAKARAAAETPLVYAAMLVRLGHATGTVGGAVHTTGDVVRSAIQVIGMAPDAGMVSSFFLMYPPDGAPDGARAMLYSDCGLVIDPNPAEMVSIAAASARSASALLRVDPKLAFLSFSTKGSAKHPAVDKVTEALGLFQNAHPDLQADGELQFDAAFVPAIGERKSPGSSVAGQANVMIFPNLDAGNIGYKITQRLGGYSAIGPVLQGLAKPANDLSRGCSAEDVTQIIAVTILQAAGAPGPDI
ncbi:phosphate acetyltransferase [Leisingera sp. NJS204]|uniref:phosphate acetyltransferase n=1 Tax=Leisingera sp. NJS204 TaxID=2508307 RepID=UPI001011F538|nr:phosphate acetyltransferase [Leisingera sp. NJS204]QAX30844.1 phosphate acetyltransferase [Leisingera sp. NJS204]